MTMLIFLGLGQAVCYVVMSKGVQYIYDDFLIANDFRHMRELCRPAAVMLLAALLNCLAFMKERVLAEHIGQGVIHRLRAKIFRHLVRVYPKELERKNKGGMSLRLVNDMMAIRQWITLGLSRIVVSGVCVVLTLTALASMSIELSVTVFFFVILGVAYSVFLGPVLKQCVSEVRKRRARLANNVGEKINAIRTIQVFGQERYETRKVKRQSSCLVDAMVERARMIGLLRGGVMTITGLSTMGALLVGSYLVSIGKITAGTVAAFISIIGFLVPALRDFGRIYEYWVSFKVAAEKIAEVFELPRMKVNRKGFCVKDGFRGEVEFKEVRVQGVFSHFSAKVKAKSKIVITGLNGVGKSTLFNLLLGVAEPDQGTILVDGKSLEKWDIRSLRTHIGVVSPNVPLLRGSLKKNVTYSNHKIADDHIHKVIEILGLSEKVNQLPHGLQARLLERGCNFSSGEQQVFALTRALLGKPKILLLDEVDSHLDAPAQKMVAELIRNYEGTVLFITHHDILAGVANDKWELSKKKDVKDETEHEYSIVK
ncbi:MAG: ABC transporter ATP-binding protein [Candidatus Omnitrophica bacterium]|nr:ABC transporter ATP-binding protein [Candidatus Omnitrophota bacterium]